MTGDVEVRLLDVSDLTSVRDFATEWTGHLDILVNNAGIMDIPLTRTKDHLDLQTATNSFGPFLLTNHVDAALDACLRGLGCAQFLSYQVEAHVKAGTLRRVLADFEPLPVPIHLVYPHARLLSPNVRAFVDLAVAHFRGRH